MIAERLEQRQLLAANSLVQVLDDHESGFVATDQWESSGSNGSHYQNGAHELSADNSGIASWTFTVAPGKYQVSTTWLAGSNRSKQAPFTIVGDEAGDVSVTVNQEILPTPDTSEFVGSNEYQFENLGLPIDVVGSTLTVTLHQPDEFDSGDTSGDQSRVVADAIRIERVTDVRSQITDEFNWVYENVDLEFYPGLKKGPQATAETRAASPWDQAALLVDRIEGNADLQAAGVTATIVKGKLTVNDDDFVDWVGTTHPNAALQIVGSAFDPNVLSFSNVVVFQHVWVRVSFPTGAGTQTVNLDPSWKKKDRQPGILVELPGGQGTFDEFDFLATPGEQLPIEYYEDKVMDYLAAQGQGASLADVAFDGPILPRSWAETNLTSDPHLQFASATSSLGNFSDILANSTKELNYTHRVQITVGTRASDGVFTALGSKHVTVPESALDSFAVKRTAPSKLTYYVNGAHSGNIATNLSADAKLEMVVTHASPGVSFSDTAKVRKATHKLGNEVDRTFVISLGADQHSHAELDRRRAAINDAVEDGVDTDDIDEVLNYISARYWQQLDKYANATAKLMHVVDTSTGVSSGVVFADGSLVAGVPDDFSFQQVPIIPENTGVDLPNSEFSPLSMHYDGTSNTELSVDEAFQLAGYTASALEHAVLEEVLHNESISTVRGLKDAYKGDPVIVGSPANSVMVIESVDTSSGRKVYLRGEVGERVDEIPGSVPYQANRTDSEIEDQAELLDLLSSHRTQNGQSAYVQIGALNEAVYAYDTLVNHGYIM